MARSACPKCGKFSFEMVENTPEHSNYKLRFVQCKACGAVVGVLDYTSTELLIKQLEKTILKNLP